MAKISEVLTKLVEDQGKIIEQVATSTKNVDEKLSAINDRIANASLLSSGRKLNSGGAKAVELSDNRLKYLTSSGTYKKVHKVAEYHDRGVTELEYANLLNKANDYASRADFRKYEEFYNSLSTRERDVYRLSVLNEGLIIPEFLGIYDCNKNYTILSDLYDNVQVSSEEFKYVISSEGEYDYSSLISDCATGCQPAKPLDIDFNNRVKSGGMLKFDASICTSNVGKTYYADTLRMEIDQVVQVFRKAREYALMNSSVGWLKQSVDGVGFEKYRTSRKGALSVNDLIQTIASFNQNYNNLVVVMHPNMFAVLMNEFDMFGKPILALDTFNERLYSMLGIRVRFVKSDLLPDATHDGSFANKDGGLPSGSFAFAVADWQEAYAAVTYQDILFKYLSVDSFFCERLVAGAKFSGFIKCPSAGKIVNIQ